MHNKYYHDELLFLREMGRDFCRAHPEAAPFLGEAGNDPDVERLLEGFAFLTARIRQKLDDELPEITHVLLDMFWPHYLRPIPAMSIVRFEPRSAANEVLQIPRGTELDSVPIDGVACRFRTAYDVSLLSLIVTAADLQRVPQPQIRLRIQVPGGASLSKMAPDRLRLHLVGEKIVTRALFLCLCNHLQRISVRPIAGEAQPIALPGARVEPVGMGDQEALLAYPNNSFPGFRLLQEYFSFPAKFMFLDITGLGELQRLGEVRAFELIFELDKMPESVPPITAANFALNCTPVVNLFPHEADPIRVNREATEYQVRPAGKNPAYYEIYSIDQVIGLARGTAARHEYQPMFRRSEGLGEHFYRARTEHAIAKEGTDVSLTFVSTDGTPEAQPEMETISIELTCSNRHVPSRLGPGDIKVPTSSSPSFAHFSNITRPTASVPPPLGGLLYWKLISHLSLNYHSLMSVDALRNVLTVYNFRALFDRQAEQAHQLMLDGILEVAAVPATRLFRGTPIRGFRIRIKVLEDNFGSPGGLYLFGSLLSEFLSQYVTLNAFSQLVIEGTKTGEIYTWPARIGHLSLL
ncbi:type VI secretion system baseplate subunit TssF [Acidimicrobium ferrooxidans]|nr:type VI secretion system baseplate subunit TssF [Acidimicrobium ferrooxidans]